MKAKPLILPKRLSIAMAGVSIAMMIGLFYNKYNNIPVEISWLYISLALLFVPFLVVLLDLIRNPIAGKVTWIIFLTTVSVVATFFYLVMRDKILEKSNLKS